MSARSLPRLDGVTVWATLTPEVQAEIGAIAIELVGGWACEDELAERQDEGSADSSKSWDRAAFHFDGSAELNDALHIAVVNALPRKVFFVGETPRLPVRWGKICRNCGCSNDDACGVGCSWVEDDLCSACNPQTGEAAS